MPMGHSQKTAQSFTFIGSDRGFCPSCGTLLDRPPQKKAKCQHCGNFIFVRTRPIDEKRVLLKESDLEQLELEWGLDYKIKQDNRTLSPEWEEKMAAALTDGPHPNEMVEHEAWKVFEMLATEPYSRMAPRDARDKLLSMVDQRIRVDVDRRLWQLLVKSIHCA